MTEPVVDQPPAAPSSPVTDWGAAITQQTGTERPLTMPAEGPQTKVDQPPAGASPDAFDQEAVANMRQDRELRVKYADKAYKLATGCLSMWTVMIFSQGIIKAIIDVEMWNDKVLIAVTTGVTVSVLAAFLGVIRGLFGPNAASSKRGTK